MGVGYVAFSPLANGFLSAKYDKNSSFNKTFDYRSNMPQFTEKGMEQNAALLDLLAKIASEKNAASAQISLAWMLCKKPYIVPIPGTRKLERLRENAAAADVFLTPDEVKTIDITLDDMEMSEIFGGSKVIKDN